MEGVIAEVLPNTMYRVQIEDKKILFKVKKIKKLYSKLKTIDRVYAKKWIYQNYKPLN
jgi:translation initiation factor IF-1